MADEPPNETTPVPAPALGATVGRGMSRLMVATLVGKLASTLSQVVLGVLLTDTQFGVFAAAASIAGFLNLLRDGGTYQILVQRGARDYDKVAGELFWFGLSASLISALVLLAASIPVSALLFDEPTPEVRHIMLVIAASTPLSVVAGQFSAKLRIDLRFEAVSKLTLYSSLLRQGSMVLFAVLGAGSLSFAYPYLVCAVFETIYGYTLTRERVWTRPAHPRTWPGYFGQGFWVLTGTGANFLLDYGPYIAASALLARNIKKEVLGVFYFAFQISAQLGVIFGFVAQLILFPVLTRLNDEPERQAQAIVRSLHALMLVGCAASLALCVAIDPLEKLIWGGKWDQAVFPVIVLGLFFPWRISYGLTTAVLHARGEFRRHALLTMAEGLGLTVAASVACLVDPTPRGLATASGIWLFIGRLGVTIHVMRSCAVGPWVTIRALAPSWLLAAAAAASALAVDRWVNLAPWVASILAPAAALFSADLGARLAGMTGQLVRLAASSAVFVLIFGVLARQALAGQIRDAISLAPARLRRLTSLLFL